MGNPDSTENSMNLPEDLRYTADHEWVLVDGDIAIVGISDPAQEQLGDIIRVALPEVGEEFATGDEIGSIQTGDETRELYAAVSGEILEVNEDVVEDASVVNSDPYDEGWLYKVAISSHDEIEQLMEAIDYEEFLNE